MHQATLFAADAAATEAVGARLAAVLRAPATVFLSGELGAGKTTVARGFLHACGIRGPVKSPTFTLVESYRCPRFEVFHFDLYRISDPAELELAGWRDYFRDGAVCLIEWPERLGDAAAGCDVSVALSVRESGRQVTIETLNSIIIKEIGG